MRAKLICLLGMLSCCAYGATGNNYVICDNESTNETIYYLGNEVFFVGSGRQVTWNNISSADYQVMVNGNGECEIDVLDRLGNVIHSEFPNVVLTGPGECSWVVQLTYQENSGGSPYSMNEVLLADMDTIAGFVEGSFWMGFGVGGMIFVFAWQLKLARSSSGDL